jgi:hypothetical protein
MLDVHPPHAPTHSWKDFFIHIATIVIGLLIAVGLEQTVEYFHHRHQLAEAREALDRELEVNKNRIAGATAEFRRFTPILQTDLAILRFSGKTPGRTHVTMARRVPVDHLSQPLQREQLGYGPAEQHSQPDAE